MAKKWVTPEQQAWLKERLPLFAAAQLAKNATTQFYPNVHRDWCAKWPIPEPTPDEVAASNGLIEQARKVKRTKIEEVSDAV